MNIPHPQDRELTPDETQELQNLRSLIEAAVADGKLTPDEMEQIRAAACADNKVTFAELELYRTLIRDQIQRGELTKTWE
jgi:uncharacterized membrane protein YebE (DUF533 family)